MQGGNHLAIQQLPFVEIPDILRQGEAVLDTDTGINILQIRRKLANHPIPALRSAPKHVSNLSSPLKGIVSFMTSRE